jgi:hypothetical protein
VARLPRCWPEPSCFDSAAAFPTRSEAQWRLATLPLVEAGFLAFEQLTEFTTLRQVIDRGAVIRS